MMFPSFRVMIFSPFSEHTELQQDIFDIQPSLIGFGAHTPSSPEGYPALYIRNV